MRRALNLPRGTMTAAICALAQARLVLVGLEERARAAARHLTSYKINRARCSLWLRVELPKQVDYADFVVSEASRSLFVRLLSHRAADAALSKVIHRRASGKRQKSGRTPRTRNRTRS